MLKTAPGAPPNSTVEGAPPQLARPAEHAVHGTLDHECASETGTVRGELGDSLRAIARREAVSRGEFLLATVAGLLQRSCQPDNLRIIAGFGESQTREFHLSGGASTLQ